MIKIKVYPDVTSGGEWSKNGNQHLQKLVENIKLSKKFSIQYYDSKRLIEDGFNNKNENIVYFINWPDQLYFHLLSKSNLIARIFSIIVDYFPEFLKIIIFNRLILELENIILRLYNSNQGSTKLIFYMHDLVSHARSNFIQNLDCRFKKFLLTKSNIVFYAENSSADTVESFYNIKTNRQICHLGSYSEFHGILPCDAYLRNELGIKLGVRVILMLGVKRRNRDHQQLINTVKGLDDIFIIISGVGYKSSNGPTWKIFGGFIKNDFLLKLIAASDYIINPSNNYLTSGVLRLSLSYKKPVIAYNYGSNIDMCKNCIIPIVGNIQENYELFRSLPYPNSRMYESLVKNAATRDHERTWKDASNVLIKSIDDLHNDKC